MLKRKMVVLVVALGILGITVPAGALWLPPNFGSPVFPAVYTQIYADTDFLTEPWAHWIYRGTFQGGVRHRFVLVVPRNVDFDIKIFDENENLVASGTKGRGEDEVVYLTPAWTGRFTIVVYSYSGRGWYTLRVYRRTILEFRPPVVRPGPIW